MEPQPNGEEAERLEQFENDFISAFADIDFLGDDEEFFLPIQPESFFSMGDQRTFDELSREEQEILKNVTFQELEIPIEKEPERTYTVAGPPREDGEPSETHVRIFSTNRSDKKIFLHEMNYEDGSVGYALAPEDAQMT